MKFLTRIANTLATDLLHVAALVTKWLFVVSAPMLMIVTAFYLKTGKAVVEPLAALVIVQLFSQPSPTCDHDLTPL